MRVLVTGAGGYLGRAVLAQLLEAGHQPVGLVRRAEPDVEGVTWRRGDVLSKRPLRGATRDVDAVVHLAALAGVRCAFDDPTRYYRVNVGGSLNLLEALASRSGQPARLLLASTVSVYGAPVWPLPITENTPTAPGNPYAASKLVAEQAVAWQVATGRLGAVVLRICNIAGGFGCHGDRDDSRLIARACAVASGRIPNLHVYGDGGAVRDFVHVVDVARAFVAALDVCAPGLHRTVNIGATPASVAEVVEVTRRVTGHEVPVVWHPAHPGEVRNLRVDTARARETLGWRPIRSELDQLVADQWAAERSSATAPAELEKQSS